MTSSSAHSRLPLAAPLRAALRVRLFHKILAANAGVIVLVTLALGTRTVELAAEPRAFAAVALAGLLLSLGLNALLVRLALEPLRALEATARRIAAGDPTARAPDSPLADAAMTRLIGTFNDMLDRLDGYRRRVSDLAGRALHAAEEERARIARSLTDETAQSLAALQLRLRIACRMPPELRDEVLQLIAAQMADAVEEVRAAARELRAPPLELLGLEASVELDLKEFERTTGLEVERELRADAGALSREASLALYRIIQEALSNIARHARARRVAVRLARRDGGIEALIEDDGLGFDPAMAEDGGGRGLGLVGIRERASYVGGRAVISSGPGRGTRVRAFVPSAEAVRNV